MKGDYPRWKASYDHEELSEYFSLSDADYSFVSQFRGDVNRHAVAVLLKSLLHLDYFPNDLTEVPETVRTFIASQLGLLWDSTDQYPWQSSTKDYHLAQIRRYTGWRFATANDKKVLETWLSTRSTGVLAYTEEDLMERAYERLRSLSIELPAERELRRIVATALTAFFQHTHERIASRLTTATRDRLDQLLVVPTSESVSGFEAFKADPPGPSVDNLKGQVAKLQALRAVGLTAEIFKDIPLKALQVLKRRARNEKASEMREHSDTIRHALLASYIYVRTIEVIDAITLMTVEMIHRIDTQTEKHLTREILRDIKRVEGKMQILYRVSEAVVETPDGTVREVIFPHVKEETFRRLLAEFKTSGSQYWQIYQVFMQHKYVHHYRRILPYVLENIEFRSDNRFQPVIEALGVIKRYLRTKHQYFPEPVPLEGVVIRRWANAVIEEVDGKKRINRKYYELCVLGKLERALKCKEIWVEGSYAYRNPSEDLPSDWANDDARCGLYQTLSQPLEARAFIDPLREQLTAALTSFNRNLPRNPYVKIYFPNKNDDRGLFRVAKLEARPEPQSLGIIKTAINRYYGMLDLLDVFVEADRYVDFTRFFSHSGTKEVRPREVLRPLLLLDLYAEGTNTGIKRVAKANRQYSYDELLYVRKSYFSIEALRNANAAVVNKFLQVRNPGLWGEGYACASDGKRFESWSQNLLTEWRSRYRGYGVLVYWHVATNAICIYSQLRSFSSSEVAAMIQGLVRHDTEMRVEKNFVDSHGHSVIWTH